MTLEKSGNLSQNSSSDSEDVSTPTQCLWEIPMDYLCPDLPEVEQLIRHGADVNWHPSMVPYPTLLAFCSNCDTACTLACLKTERRINFCLTDRNGQTFLHLIPSFRYEKGVVLLQALLERLRERPGDKVDWELEDSRGDRFIDLVGSNQLGMLSRFYPLLRDAPYFRDHSAPISLRKVWSWDWEALEEEDQRRFDVSPGVIRHLDRPTAELWTLSQVPKTPNLIEVERLVKEGANVSWSPDSDAAPLITQFSFRTNPTLTLCILACLKSDGPIDFSAGSQTLLHRICYPYFTLTDATDILHAIVLHVERHPRDIIDWAKEERRGTDFIHTAARMGRLSAFYSIVSRTPYFDDHVHPIEIETVIASDWLGLSDDHRKNFIAKEIVGQNIHQV